MIVVDTSAIVAIALGESEQQQFVTIIKRAEKAPLAARLRDDASVDGRPARHHNKNHGDQCT
jgi:uncharacterized protein with PIN domain